MWIYPKKYEIIVIGAGHAGCEAAHAGAKMGAATLLLTMNLDTIAKMSCNPAIGGTAKGHIVRELDALGGIIGKIADRTGIQFRMLNASKGPAVWSPRTQSDKLAYHKEMKKALEGIPNLDLKQGTANSLLIEDNKIQGVLTAENILYRGAAVILCSGTFMQGLVHIGDVHFPGGRSGDSPSIGISRSLQALGFDLKRLKTGTPPRIHRNSIDFSKIEEQFPEDELSFSFDPQEKKLPQISCFITYTTEKTKEIILQNLHRSPLFSGKIQGIGPRYCPSIEDKIVRFKEKKRHQLFLEPEGIDTDEFYINGLSSSLPFDIQYDVVHSICGLENAEIMRPAYAIEYDFVTSGQIAITLETKKIGGLYLAGQINGTTGYEEAAAQGFMAAINAVQKLQKKPPFILKRSEAYIGVLLDDITSKQIHEPYRMFTSRAEYRLLLRQDNADLRLRPYGYQLGLINEKQYEHLIQKQAAIEKGILQLQNTPIHFKEKRTTLAKLLSRPEHSYAKLLHDLKDQMPDFGKQANTSIEIDLKYAGYILREAKNAAKIQELEEKKIPSHFDYTKVIGLRNEAKEKLLRFLPHSLGQASRIDGVSPADISILMVALKRACS